MFRFVYFISCVCLILFSNTTAFTQGNGSDGPLNVIATTTINNTATDVTGANATGSTVNVTSTAGFTIGDEVLIMQMFGTNAGSYDRLVINAITTTSFTFAASTTVAYSGAAPNKAQVIKIPQYTSVTINAGGTLKAPAWNGTTGGVLIFYSATTTAVNGSITMDGAGFQGGTGGAAGVGAAFAGVPTPGGLAPGAVGMNAPLPGAPNGGNGGAGAGKGGAGGNANVAAGTLNAGTAGSGIAGNNPSVGTTALFMGGGGASGSGGQGGGAGGAGGGGGAASAFNAGAGAGGAGGPGGAGANANGIGGNGGQGGGIILLYLNDFTGNGAFSANGTNGTNSTGTGGNGGIGGSGGNGGSANNGAPINGGGGGGAGQAGRAGTGPSGGSGGAAGVIVVNIQGTSTWTGNAVSSPGLGGTGGAAGTPGAAGVPGGAGAGTNGGAAGILGGPFVGPIIVAAPGGTGSAGGTSQAPLITVPAPVELLGFSGKVTDNKISLSWSTVSEKNNSGFTIEKSSDGQRYTTLTNVQGAVNSITLNVYTTEDLYPLEGNNYYRLKQTDVDGTITQYASIVLLYSKQSFSYTVFPNPVEEEKVVSIYGNEKDNSIISVFLYNNLEELIWKEETGCLNKNDYSIRIPSSLAPGIYYISIYTLSGNFKNKLIVK